VSKIIESICEYNKLVRSSPQTLYYSLKFDRPAVGTHLSFHFELYDLTLQCLIENVQRIVQCLQGYYLQHALLTMQTQGGSQATYGIYSFADQDAG